MTQNSNKGVLTGQTINAMNAMAGLTGVIGLHPETPNYEVLKFEYSQFQDYSDQVEANQIQDKKWGNYIAKPNTIENTLVERSNRYGDFKDHASIAQNIKRAMVNSKNWNTLPDIMKEALEMTAHKIGRILNGDPNYKDSWIDIQGYIKLVSDTLKD